MKNFMAADYMSYRLAQWVVLFFIYGFLGWIWESIYMSLLERKPLNRGFLYGPFIPIYGVGATMVLFTTMPFSDKWWAVALIGMIVGTVMEEVAGRVMEQIFDVKYWTYEGYPGNIDDFICIPATLLWGFFSVFTLYFLNKPFDYFVRNTNYNLLVLVGFLGVIVFTVDVTLSVKNALDFKELMIKVNSGREELTRIRKRLDVLITFYDEKHRFTERLKNSISSRKDMLGGMLETVKIRIDVLEELKKNYQEKKESEEEAEEFFHIKEQYKEQEFFNRQYLPRIKRHIKRLLYSSPRARLKKLGVSLKEFGSGLISHWSGKNEEE